MYRQSHITAFWRSLETADSFPKNIVYTSSLPYQLEEYVQQLDHAEVALFGPERSQAVDFLELFENQQNFTKASVKNEVDLDARLGVCDAPYRKDPVCRFVFVSAPHARARLSVVRATLVRLMSWHQIMPEFLDFLFAFGSTEHPKDYHFSGFRSETDIDNGQHTLRLPEFGRSGRELRICYNIKSVERVNSSTKSQRNWPWSVRQSSAYHSFDVETQKSFWLIIKANKLIRDRTNNLCDDPALYRADEHGEMHHGLDSTLRTHLLLCTLAGENWRWYINFIEERVQELTRGTLTETVDQLSELARVATTSRAQSWSTTAKSWDSKPTEKVLSSRFSFEHLQEVHFVEEKANEALLILRANASVFRELLSFYSDAMTLLATTPNATSPSPAGFAAFRRSITIASKDLAMQQSRLEMLLRLLTDRRSLLESLLQWKNAQLNLLLADKAQASAEKMELMTEAMHTIAQETKTETINMRIITLVTLFFLPGTFISTLMSTAIVQFGDGKLSINSAPLLLYIEVSLPLLCGTLGFWYLTYKWENFKNQRRQKERGPIPGQPP